jgi:hypothetical protein
MTLMRTFRPGIHSARLKFVLPALCLLLGCIAAKASTPAQANFVQLDTTTQGNWRGVYGADGYSVAGDSQSIPLYASFAIQNQVNYTWDAYPAQSQAQDLERASISGRIAATWYNPQTYYFDINFTDGNTHQLALYALDWDGLGRSETVQVVDANTSANLDSETISNFTNGNYLVWNISGHVIVYVKTVSGPNCVISGVFFGAGVNNSFGVVVNPPIVTLAAGQTQQFSASVLGSPNTPVVWSISPNTGTISSTGLYTSPSTVSASETVTVTATDSVNTSLYGISTIVLIPGASATFITSDTSTQGNWQGTYGMDGYSIAGDSQSLPSYASFSVQNQVNYTWASTTTDPRALELSSGAGRIAATWYNPQSFSLAVDFNDRNSHQFSIYAVDWDSQGRAETIQILDANTNAVLDTEDISNFTNGVYLVWSLSGDVIINVTCTGGPNAVVSGAFFGAGDPPTPAVVSFIASDAATQGNWQGAYGTDGYAIANDSQSIPAYATFTVQNQLNYTWAATTSDPRALETAEDSGRIAACWYSPHDAIPPTFSFDVNFTDGNSHQVALYALDWDEQGRTETITIVDAQSKAILDTRNISNFTGGLYLLWNISGHVTINVTSTGGPNGVISGVFFGGGNLINVTVSPQSLVLPLGQSQPFTAAVTGTTNQNVVWSISPSIGSISSSGVYTAPATLTSTQPITVTATSEADGTRFGTATINLTSSSAAFLSYDTTTQGNWQGVYGSDGYSIANDSQSIPTYASFAVENQNGEWTWATGTTDPRALETAEDSGRIAACWYKNHDSFSFSINLNDGNTHQIEFYALDWDSQNRSETIQVLDAATNALLDTRTISNFTNGLWIAWNISGNVIINVNVATGANAVVSGVFFK